MKLCVMNPGPFLHWMSYGLLIVSLYSCDLSSSDDEARYTACTNGTNYSRYTERKGYPAEHFSTSHWESFYVWKNQLIRTGPLISNSVYTTDWDIYTETIMTTPKGGLYFMDGKSLYYRDIFGQIKASDMQDGLYPMVLDYWFGTCFLTDAGHYAYFDRNGSHTLTLRVRNTNLNKLLDVYIPNIPEGDCLAGYQEGTNTYSVIHHFNFQGTEYVKRYSITPTTGTIYLQTFDLNIPEETKKRQWRNFIVQGNQASFDIYERQTIKHYTIDLYGNGTPSVGPETQRYIYGPACYYAYETVSAGEYQKLFRVKKYSWNHQLQWTVDVKAGDIGFWDTYGWADDSGIFLISDYDAPNSNQPESNQLYISADGKLCDP